MAKSKSERPRTQWGAEQIEHALFAKYALPTYATFCQVANGTGVRQYRYADVITMGLWPSRGLWLEGFEIKVSRSDWRRELADPGKADPIASRCDLWWIVAPRDVVPATELPESWGLQEWDGRAFHVRKPAVRNPEPRDMNREFLAALLRRACEANIPQKFIDDIRKDAMEDARKAAAIDIDMARKDYKRLQEQLAAFEAASGIKIDAYYPGGQRLGEAVRKVLNATDETYTLQAQRSAHERAIAVLDELMALRQPKPADPLDELVRA